jgi:hypothetical protein
MDTVVLDVTLALAAGLKNAQRPSRMVVCHVRKVKLRTRRRRVVETLLRRRALKT